MQTRLIMVLTIFGLVLAFQNCAKSRSASGVNASDNLNANEQVIGPTASYTKVTYDPRLEALNAPAIGPRLDIDVEAGEVKISVDNQSTICPLGEADLGALKAVLAQSQVCMAGPSESGVQCQAIALADIELASEDGASVQLRPVVCNHGTFLCGGNDQVLRDLLTRLAKQSACK